MIQLKMAISFSVTVKIRVIGNRMNRTGYNRNIIKFSSIPSLRITENIIEISSIPSLRIIENKIEFSSMPSLRIIEIS